jgi:microcystin-dependent protein
MIVQFAGNFAPRGWAFCQNQILSISQNTALFSILGTTYGGNGQTTFALPDFRGRAIVGAGQGPGLSPYNIGEVGGAENVTLTQNNLPTHTHAATLNLTSSLTVADAPSTNQQAQPNGASLLGRSKDGAPNGTSIPWIYVPTGTTPTTTLGGLNVAGTVTNALTGNGLPTPILSPYGCVNVIIALQGIFPSRN